MKYPLISIQILNWNRAHETQRAIQSALNQTYPNTEVVLIDNGSTDDSLEISRRNFPSIKIVALEENYGCPGGRNMGIKYCSGRYIFYLDNDGVLHREAVFNAYTTMISGDNVGVVTGIVYDFEFENEIDPHCYVRSDVKYYFNNFQGGICLHDKSIYSKAGYYPSHFLYGSEEYFLTFKIVEAGFNIVKDESVVLWHKRSSLARDRSRELESSFFNKLYVAVCLFPVIPSIFFVAYFVPKYIYYSYRHGFSSVFLKNYFTKFSHTIRRGLRNRNAIGYSAYLKVRRFKRRPIGQGNPA
jgi:glycosyltransferase involved in cell wall biosynthesis